MIYKKSLLTLAVMLALPGARIAWAQSAPTRLPPVDASGITRSAEELVKPKRKAAVRPQTPDTTPLPAVSNLRQVQVNGTLLNKEIADYWVGSLNKPVSAEQMTTFKDWIYQRLEDRGYLGYVDMKEERSADGSTLRIEVIPVKVGRITVDSTADKVDKAIVDELARRFSQRFPMGQVLDVLDLEAQLDASTYDMPVVLNVNLAPPTGGSSEIKITVANAAQKPLTILGASVQVNNYGLEQFGRGQVLGVMRVEGFTPLSTLTLTGLHSERVDFARADYDMPLVGLYTHLRGWVGASHSSASLGSGLESANESDDIGLGTTTLLGASRSGTLNMMVELNRHGSRDTTGGSETSNSVDTQFRLKLDALSHPGWLTSLENEVSLTMGDLDLSGNASDLANDALNYMRQGQYQKLELSGRLSKDFASDWTASMRWRGQFASKNLSAYNRIGIGGMSGIRAYTTADGVGDEGSVFSFDLIRHFGEDFYVGALYDAGTVKLAVSPLANTTTNRYTLQGAGLQMGGTVNKFVWNLNAARSFGDGQDTSLDTSLTPVGTWRVNFELSRPF